MMTGILELGGYRVVGLLLRRQRKRRRVHGRARGWYSGEYVYLRVRLPDGTRRDLYLGRPGVARRRGRPSRDEKSAPTVSDRVLSDVQPVPEGKR